MKKRVEDGIIFSAKVNYMLIDELKKANVQALKDHDSVKRAILGVVISQYMLVNVENRKDGKETTDAEVVSILQKAIKGLEEEKAMFEKGNREDKVKDTLAQMDLLKSYL